MNKVDLWQAVLGELEVSLSSAEFKTWFSQTTIVSQQDHTFVIGVTNNFAKERLKKKYSRDIKTILAKAAGLEQISLDFALHTGPIPKQNTVTFTTKVKKKVVETLTLDIAQTNLNPRYTFSSFIIGSSNRLAHAAAVAVAKSPGQAYSPLFVYSGVGLGKTHLLQAIGMHVLQEQPDKKVLYTTSEKFMNDLIYAIQTKSAEKFRDKYRKNDVLLIDDIQFISGKERTQEEFFHTFNTMYEANKQVVIASDRPPKDIATLEKRLRSRFESGLLVDIQTPDYETRVAILRAKCALEKIEIPPKIIEFLARAITNNVRELEGGLNSIIAHAELEKSPITFDLAEQVAKKIVGENHKKVRPQEIIKLIIKFYGLSIDELMGNRRDKKISLPRQIAMYLLRTESYESFESIGNLLGNRDHSTVMHACDKIEKAIATDQHIDNEITLLRERLSL